MTVYVEKPAINLREELTSLRYAIANDANSHIRFDFKNLVVNGGFDSDTAWTKGTGWTISGGKANFNSAANNGVASSLTYNTPVLLDADKSFLFSMVFSDIVETQYRDVYAYIPGLGQVSMGDGYTSTPIVEDVIDTALVSQPNTTTLLEIRANSNIGLDHTMAVDNLSLWEADPSDGAPWLRLPHGFAVGRTGWIVRDNDTLHPEDYEEITVLGQTWIKPLVAPGHATRFSVWGKLA